MKNKTALLVVLVALALFAYIFFIDGDTMSTTELEGRKDRVFREFKREFVQSITVTGTSGEKVTLERATVEEGEDEWKITSPRKLGADPSSVRAMLSAIDFLLVDRAVKSAGEIDKPRYGLVKPGVTASLVLRGGSDATTFKIGAPDATGEKVYVSIEGLDEFYAVEKEFLKSMDLDLAQLRDKHLLGEDLAGATSVEVVRPSGTLTATREGVGAWKLKRGETRILAAADQVNSLLREVGDLRATEFLADGVKDEALGEFGLKSPERTVTVKPAEGDAVKIVVGGPCGDGDRAGVAAMVAGLGVVACVSSEITAVLDAPASRFEERRPAVFVDGDVEKISVSRNGVVFVLEHDDDGEEWRGVGEHADLKVEQEAVSDLLSVLAESRAVELVVGEQAVAELGEPEAVVKLEIDSGREEVELELWAGEEGGTRVRRAGEQALLRVAEDLLAVAVSDPLFFRRRQIDHGVTGELEEVEIRGESTQKIQRKDGAWSVVSPVESTANSHGADDVAKFLTEMKVERFAAKQALPEHGLNNPTITIEGSFASPDTQDENAGGRVVVEVGATAPGGGRFARVKGGDQAVFEIGSHLVEILGRPLVANHMPQITIDNPVKVEFEVDGKPVVAQLTDGAWISSEVPGLDSVTLKRLLLDLGAVKAVRTHGFAPATDLGKTTLAVKIWPAGEGEAQKITFGERTSIPEEEAYIAAKDGLDVSFAVPARVVDELIVLLSSPPQ